MRGKQPMAIKNIDAKSKYDAEKTITNEGFVFNHFKRMFEKKVGDGIVLAMPVSFGPRDWAIEYTEDETAMNTCPRCKIPITGK